MQAAIDSAKRRFDINITDEIHLIKKDMEIDKYKYPAFWLAIKKGFNKKNINYDLHCPMNYVYNLKHSYIKNKEATLPNSMFFKYYPHDVSRKSCKRVETMIETFAIKISEYNHGHKEFNEDKDILLLRDDFDNLVAAIRGMRLSGTYVSLFSWLIDRAFVITPDVARNSLLATKLNKNKSILLKVLYESNKENLLKCFSNNVQTQ